MDLQPDDYAGSVSTTANLPTPQRGNPPSAQIFGDLETVGDHDWFRVFLNAGTPYRFDNIQRTPYRFDNIQRTLVGPTLAIRDRNGATLAFKDEFKDAHDENRVPVPRSTIFFTPAVSDNYYIDAGPSPFGDGFGTYTIQGGVDDYDDITSTNGSIPAGSTATGQIDFIGDNDWFRVQLTAGHNYAINLRMTEAGTTHDLALALMSGSGSALTGFDPVNGTSPSLTGLGELSVHINTSGTYFVRVGENISNYIVE